MPYYLMQLTYTPEAWSTQVRNPQNRIEAVRPVVEQAGGSIECAYFAFGEYDLVTIVQVPDNVTAASLSLAFTTGGAIKAIKTTPLMTIDDGMEAMRRASGTSYRPPQ